MTGLKPWTSWALNAAGACSLAWAATSALQPAAVQTLFGLGSVHPPAVWFGLLGAIALGGFALFISAADPSRYWPLILLCVVWKSGALAVALLLFWQGSLEGRALVLSAVDGALWSAVLGAVLLSVRQETLSRRRCGSREILGLALRTRTSIGVSLEELSRLSPILLVFLRPAGCMFCREALSDLAGKRKEIEATGTRLVVIHMGTEEQGNRLFARYGLEHTTRIDDPRRTLYRAFGLPRGTIGMFLSPWLWVRCFQAAVLDRNLVGRFTGDFLQLPGVFLLYYGQLVRCHRHQSPADRPDYVALVTGVAYAAEEFRG